MNAHERIIAGAIGAIVARMVAGDTAAGKPLPRAEFSPREITATLAPWTGEPGTFRLTVSARVEWREHLMRTVRELGASGLGRRASDRAAVELEVEAGRGCGSSRHVALRRIARSAWASPHQGRDVQANGSQA